jgi:hypothetical protein
MGVAKSESGCNFKAVESCRKAMGHRGIVPVALQAVEEAEEEANLNLR